MTVVSDKPYLDDQMGTLQKIVESTKGLSISTSSYGSTTSIPSKEPPIVQKYLEAAKTFSEKLYQESYNIYSVAEDIANMDNFLATESTNLGFNVVSNPVDVTELTNESKTNLSELLGKEVPIVQGYNDKVTTPVGTGSALGSAAGSSYSGGSSSGGYSSGGSSTSISTPTTTTPQITTTTPTQNTPVEQNTPQLEPNVALTNTPVEQNQPVTQNTPAEQNKPQLQPQDQTIINNYYYNNGGGGGGNYVSYGEPVEETQNVDENFGKQEIVVEEVVEPQPEEIVQEIPLQEEIETVTEEVDTEEFVPVETVTVEPDQTANTSAKTLKTMAVLAGAGLTAGAAAVAIHEYKKTQDDNSDEEDDDFDYDGGEV